MEELQQYSLGQTTEENADGLARHLAECQRCLQTLDALPASDTLVDTMRTHQPARLTDDDSLAVERLVIQLKQLGSTLSTSGILDPPQRPVGRPFQADSSLAVIGSAWKGRPTLLPKGPAESGDAAELRAALGPPDRAGELGRLGGYRVLKLLSV